MLEQKRFGGNEKLNIFQIDIKMFDPDNLLDRAIPWVRWIWSPWFVIPWLVIFAVVLGAMAYHWHLYWAGFFSLWNLPQKGFWDWVSMFALLVGVTSIAGVELGVQLATRLDEGHLRRAFGILLLLVAAQLGYRSLRRYPDSL